MQKWSRDVEGEDVEIEYFFIREQLWPVVILQDVESQDCYTKQEMRGKIETTIWSMDELEENPILQKWSKMAHKSSEVVHWHSDYFDYVTKLLTSYSCKLINTILYLYHTMSEGRESGYTCSSCGASFSTHEGLVNHNVDIHGAAIGAQLRQSEEIQKQRREE